MSRKYNVKKDKCIPKIMILLLVFMGGAMLNINVIIEIESKIEFSLNIYKR